jgi:hypothetical protein
MINILQRYTFFFNLQKNNLTFLKKINNIKNKTICQLKELKLTEQKLFVK